MTVVDGESVGNFASMRVVGRGHLVALTAIWSECVCLSVPKERQGDFKLRLKTQGFEVGIKYYDCTINAEGK